MHAGCAKKDNSIEAIFYREIYSQLVDSSHQPIHKEVRIDLDPGDTATILIGEDTRLNISKDLSGDVVVDKCCGDGCIPW